MKETSLLACPTARAISHDHSALIYDDIPQAPDLRMSPVTAPSSASAAPALPLRVRFLSAVVGIGMALLPAACRPVAEPSAGSAGASPAVDAADDESLVTTDYAALDFRENRFLLDGAPFTGRAVQQHPDGTPQSEMRFRDGVLHGVVREWYPDGTQSTETHFAEGVRHGPNTYWNEDGSLHKEQVWDRGRLVSETKHD